ncbi:MAG TPA: tail fiber domain-containing protein, partial [Ruminiclostridium sp.]|nr:tail fiber domain-containing protein [Ruminiclostridium sp.]
MSNEIKRMNYFNGLLLKEDDLKLDQNYHMVLHRLHNGYFHDWGIIEGLEVTTVAGYLQVKVSPGFAIDRKLDDELKETIGREIWICENQSDTVIDLSGQEKDTDVYITVTYDETKCDTDITKGENEPIHMWERGKINLREKGKLGNPSEEIILARVRVIDDAGQKKIVIDDKEADGKTQLRKYAVTEGAPQEFQKIAVGEKGKSVLPYIAGPTDDERKLYLEKHGLPVDSDGLVVHTPYTLFYGPVISDTIKTNGDMNVNGTFSVKVNKTDALQVDSKGAVSIANSADVSGILSATGGLNVSGDSATFDTQHVVMTGNMLTVNKYTEDPNKTDSKKMGSGIEVYRGEGKTVAELLWDETDGLWKAGTQDSLHELVYGSKWDSIHNGSNVDTLHKHSKIWDSSTESKEALTSDEKGNISIGQDLNVNGKVVIEQGIEVPQKNYKTNARLIWNEENQSWQSGVGDDLNNIPSGKAWSDLTLGTNADKCHNHSKLVSDIDQEALSVQSNGDVNVTSNLTVGKDLTVEGTLTVYNNATEIKYVQKTVSDNVLVVNRPEPESGQMPVSEGGLEVYRGEGLPNARIIWDEENDIWKIGTDNNMSEIPGGIEWEYLTHGQIVDDMHVHGSLAMEDGTAVLSVDSTGNVEAEKDLGVKGNLTIDKNETVMGDVDVKGSVKIEGDLTILGSSTTVNQKTLEVDSSTIITNKYSENSEPVEIEGGLEVFRGGYVPNAKLLWNEKEGKWKIGTGDSMNDVIYGNKWDALVQNNSADGLHTHARISDTNGNAAITADSAEVLINKAAKVYGGLDVDGEVNILGNLNVTGTINSVEKTDMKVQDNVILINKFDGDKPPINESGLEIFRGNSAEKARLVWDEAASLWKVGIGKKLNNLAYGTDWNILTNKSNADTLHTHSQLFNEKGNILSLNTTSAGNIDIKHDLNVYQDLTIAGNLNVKGKVTTIKSTNIDIEGNLVTLNKSETGELKQGTSTFSVFRGINEKNAVLRWNEKEKAWEIGLSEFSWVQENNTQENVPSGNSSCFRVKDNGNVEVQNDLLVNGIINAQNGIRGISKSGRAPYIKWSEDKAQWKIGVGDGAGEVNCISAKSSGYVGIGNESPNAKLDVSGNAIVSGDMTIGGKTAVNGVFSAGNTTINGSITTNGSLNINKQGTANKVVSAVEIVRGKDEDDTILENAKIIWDEDEKIWKVGYGDKLTVLNVNNAFKTTKLYNTNANEVVVNVSENSNVGIGIENPTAKLQVVGNIKVSEGKNKDGSAFGGALELDGDIKTSTGTITCVNANVSSTLTAGAVNIKNNLTIDGNLNVKGEVVTVNATTLEVKDNIVTLNKYADQPKPLNLNSGIEIFRGGSATYPNAQIIWNETDGVWQAGTLDNMKKISLDGHTHMEYQVLQNISTITDVLKVSENNVGIGTTSPTEKLTVSGNAKITGSVTAKSVSSDGAIINGSLSAKGIQVLDILNINSEGLEVTKEGAVRGKLVWNDAASSWQAGNGGSTTSISLDGHKHDTLYAKDTPVLFVNEEGNAGVGTAPETGFRLTVSGNFKANNIQGNIEG